jgi:hypothetical protein
MVATKERIAAVVGLKKIECLADDADARPRGSDVRRDGPGRALIDVGPADLRHRQDEEGLCPGRLWRRLVRGCCGRRAEDPDGDRERRAPRSPPQDFLGASRYRRAR